MTTPSVQQGDSRFPLRRARSPRSLVIGALLLGALLLHHPLRRAAYTVFSAPLTLMRACLQLFLTLPRLPFLLREREDLRAQLMRRQLELAQLREAVRSAQVTQTLIKRSRELQGIPATVIGRSTLPTQQTILLNRGHRDGVTLDTVIMDPEGVVGRIAELHQTTSVAILLTDSESRVAALVERTRETGSLVGRSRGQCELVYLDVNADLKEGDQVMTAGLGGLFPKGLLLGKVVRIVRDEQAGTASAWVEPAARLGRLEEVLCIPNPNDQIPSTK